ncbi:MAG: asparagine synthase (glutamine-hydrolyzing) [Bacteroidales bacterium]|nr:asparagine synthase (glutamine-hydrolyzing) [Bacteroidales bacterium]
MCGIAGIYSFNNSVEDHKNKMNQALVQLGKRGPDAKGIYQFNKIILGHTRLSVIDTSEAANQPFSDETGNYTIVFNGEFYNYREERKILEQKGYNFLTASDTEVLLKMYICYGVKAFEKINGCFAFGIYDKLQEKLILVRDRFGINPLCYYINNEKLIFASEIKALVALGIPKKIDNSSLRLFFNLNYIPSPHTIYENTYKLEPGNYLEVINNKIEKHSYYSINYTTPANFSGNYDDAKIKIIELLDEAVRKRLVADVPLGAFLSGGIDSSVITALASRHTSRLKTFSIGYSDEPFFDETKYAEIVAEKFKTDHKTFKLNNSDLFSELFNYLDYIDEPFADSSGLAVYLLSKKTRKHVTVALSGDGADELFAGYYKHKAHFLASKDSFANYLLKFSSPVLSILPSSRNSAVLNRIRQLKRYSKGLQLTEKERYWNWCCLMSDKQSENLILNKNFTDFASRKSAIIREIDKNGDINKILLSDVKLLLPGDMLTKTDMSSMANSLEVRTPFLDHNLVNFTFSLPSSFKINSSLKKRILQDSFRQILPQELYNRPKHGFEVPLLKWLRTELQPIINNDLLNIDFIASQNLFNFKYVERLKKQIKSGNPGEATANIWALLVFQYWWKKYQS